LQQTNIDIKWRCLSFDRRPRYFRFPEALPETRETIRQDHDAGRYGTGHTQEGDLTCFLRTHLNYTCIKISTGMWSDIFIKL
jgi:hypothetical protein